MMVAPFVLALGLAAAFLGLLGYVHHDGTSKGYRKHQIEVAEAVRATNARIAQANQKAADELAKLTGERDAAAERASILTAELTSQSACKIPEELRLYINRVNR